MSLPYVEYWLENQAVRLANSYIIRPTYFPPEWNQIRVGIIAGVTTGSLRDVSAHAQFFIGICSGANGWGASSTPTHTLGVTTWTTNVFTYSSGSAAIVYYQANGLYGVRVVNGVKGYTSLMNSSQYITFFSEANNKGRSPIYVTITKGSPNYSVRMHSSNETSPNVGSGRITDTQFLREMISTTPTFTAAEGVITSWTAQTIAASEDSGSFDRINISWNRESPNPEMLIHSVAFAVLS